MRTVETAVSALTEPARRQKGPTQAPTRFRRRRADQTAWPARIRRRLSERQVQGLEALFALRAIAQQVDDVPTGCGHGGSNPNPVRRDRPLRRTSEAADCRSDPFRPTGRSTATDRTIEQPRHLQRNRKFVDSLLEGDGFELLVTPRRNSPRARHVVSAHGSTSLERH